MFIDAASGMDWCCNLVKGASFSDGVRQKADINTAPQIASTQMGQAPVRSRVFTNRSQIPLGKNTIVDCINPDRVRDAVSARPTREAEPGVDKTCPPVLGVYHGGGSILEV